MKIETAQVSRLGNRVENQDRARIILQDGRALLLVADGMGGHVGGDIAAETAVEALAQAYQEQASQLDPAEFLRSSIIAAHRAVVDLRNELESELRPRTTITAALITAGMVRWAHVGDSRVYFIRDREVIERTRDHSAVEILAQQGLLDDNELAMHPLRNFVDQCLGGDPELPTIDISDPHPLLAGDVVLLCTDGFWSPFTDTQLARAMGEQLELQASLEALALEAELRATPVSDNVTAVALRWPG
ncbi:MAG: serine/threonine-protein phosphatase [Gammaproteobacteria bacterium]|nr:serine/threonine-protein phosphatase [Gammaproteobacteria bacterium]MDE2345352.1 serine/threonine-protein phosphatase [Gammaproteobacteria bacterium]